ncbi:hypothetical protein DSO57_1019967 [Entomophthora muscae]|uniref:Uncharacterized protein n=1 Tax=Entomophthora muscae TaxID=34485 RepID=A0ACC2SGI9_9FUNG|nr:hypothetical protein DSO57_1019967 [Entomophthora muscae]
MQFDNIFPALSSTNLELTLEEQNYILLTLDLNKDNAESISYNKFKEIYEFALNAVASKDFYQSLFELIDSNQKGFIDIGDLQKIRQSLDPALAKKQGISDFELEDMLLVGMGLLCPKEGSALTPPFDGDSFKESTKKITQKQFCQLMGKINKRPTK